MTRTRTLARPDPASRVSGRRGRSGVVWCPAAPDPSCWSSRLRGVAIPHRCLDERRRRGGPRLESVDGGRGRRRTRGAAAVVSSCRFGLPVPAGAEHMFGGTLAIEPRTHVRCKCAGGQTAQVSACSRRPDERHHPVRRTGAGAGPQRCHTAAVACGHGWNRWGGDQVELAPRAPTPTPSGWRACGAAAPGRAHSDRPSLQDPGVCSDRRWGGRPLLTKLARTVVRRRGLVALAWLAVALAGLGLSGPVFDRLGQTEGLRPDAESVRAQARIDRLLPGGPVIVAVVDGRFAYDPSLAASVTRATEDLARTAGVTDVDSIYTSPGGQVAPDNRSSLMLVELAGGLDEARLRALQDTVVARLHRIGAPRVLVGGKELAEREFAEQAVHDLARGEVLALAVLLVVLLVVFGGVVAAALPLIVAVASISGTLLVLLPVGLVTPVSEYSVNVVTLLGLGLAVDYSLLVLARFREERAAGHEPAGAVERALASAGRTVVYSALVV